MEMPRYGVSGELPIATRVYSGDGVITYYYCADGCRKGFQWPHQWHRHLVRVVSIPGILYCPDAARFEHPECPKRHRKFDTMLQCIQRV